MRDLKEIYTEEFIKSCQARAWRAPYIVQAINAVLAPKTVVDIGCGAGDIVREFLNQRVHSYGIESTQNAYQFSLIPSTRLEILDLRERDIYKYARGISDVALCFNVGEHIDVDCTKIFIHNLSHLGRVILFSSISKKKFMHRLVNFKTKEEWLAEFKEAGLIPDQEVATAVLKHLDSVKSKYIIKIIYDNLIVVRSPND